MDKAGKEKCPIYFDGEAVKGTVRIECPCALGSDSS